MPERSFERIRGLEPCATLCLCQCLRQRERLSLTKFCMLPLERHGAITERDVRKTQVGFVCVCVCVMQRECLSLTETACVVLLPGVAHGHDASAGLSDAFEQLQVRGCHG
jgi:hypothetical protein